MAVKDFTETSLSTVNLSFITGIRVSKDVIKYFNDITFFHDPNWDFNSSENATFPVAFFGIKSCHEIMKSEVSSKPLLFYNSQTKADATTASKSVLNVMADNIINQPKQYRMEIMIPASLSALVQSSHVWNTSNLIETYVSLHAKHGLKDVKSDNLRNIMRNIPYATPWLKVLKDIILMLLPTEPIYSLDQFVNEVSSSQDFNKNSLVKMWENRSVIKFKYYTGWTYKYVCITDLDISKEPTEDGIYEGTITVQEMPIITTRPLTNVPRVERKNIAIKHMATQINELLSL